MEESSQGIVIDFLREKNVDENIINTFVREKVSTSNAIVHGICFCARCASTRRRH